MKRILLFTLMMFFIVNIVSSQIAVNTTGDDPDPSAMLQVSSDSKGFLPPQMTILQRDQIQNPAAGLMIFNSDHRCINFYDGSEWIGLGCNPNLPVAALYGSDPQGDAPKEIYFNDLSTNSPTSWLWDFGDGGTSTEANPIYTYNTPGFYTVTLTVSNEYGTDTKVEVDYVTISGPGDGVPCPGTARIMDADFNEYLTVQIGTQCWMRENLEVTKYPDGTDIPNITDDTEWADLDPNNTDDAYCFYNNTNNGNGALYTFAGAVGDNWEKDNADGQGVCPDGWHLPTRDEWFEMSDYLNANGYNWDGSLNTLTDKIAKSLASKTGWKSSDVPGNVGNEPTTNNSSAFTALPSGYRADNLLSFIQLEESASWWCATEVPSDDESAYIERIAYNFYSLNDISADKSCGKTVRCIKNTAPASNPPTAAFSNTTATGQAPFYVMFTDESTGSPTSWSWDFGDGNTSTVQNAEHTYQTPGTYTVALTVTNADGSDTETKTDLIVVSPVADACPETPTVTDIDGNVYNTVQIDGQCWMRENLKVTKYPNGGDIPFYQQVSEWVSLDNNNVDDGYCYYDFNASPNDYGAYYTFSAAIADNWEKDNADGQGVCPDGWHLPINAEWTVLCDFLGGSGSAGGKMKETGTSHWNTPNTGATNESGFTGLPNGTCSNSTGSFMGIGDYGYTWSATEESSTNSWYWFPKYQSSELLNANYYKSDGYVVRCIKNEAPSNPPTAAFNLTNTTGDAPFFAPFQNMSTNNPTSWSWDFGDGGSSTVQYPDHTYTTPGTYTVSLTVSNADGSDTETKVDYVVVTDGGSDGDPCPGTPSVTDIDGNVYNTVKIGTQCWMKENLKVTKYPNDTPIPYVTGNTNWDALNGDNTDDAYCYYNDNINSEDGVLYNYAAAIADDWTKDEAEGQGVCPDGWHLPTDAEWDDLVNYLIANGYNWDGTTSGDKTGRSLAYTENWWTGSDEGDVGFDMAQNNVTDFSGRPGGARIAAGGFSSYSGENGYWWSATESATLTFQAYSRDLYYDYPNVNRRSSHKAAGMAVRCIEN